MTKGKYFTRPYGWPFPKFSPFLDIFNFYISEFIEKGTWNAIVNKYKAPPQVCPDMNGKPIEFANCFTAFIILICGAILAFLLFGLEFAMKTFDQFDPIKTMEMKQLESTINQQQYALKQMKMELAIHQHARRNRRGQRGQIPSHAMICD